MWQFLGSRYADSNRVIVEELFLQHLPQPNRLVLVAAGDLNLDRLTELADGIYDGTSAAVATHTSTPNCSAVSRFYTRINHLSAFTDVNLTSSDFQCHSCARPRHRLSSAACSYTRSFRSSSINWHHSTFRHSAHHCTYPRRW
ncbi:hypothetical protein HPB48_018564 [Haemaphysalis longicornis]|uniref:Uncharacterized protein n=1 Tax=Haemaphysalis longicornis TaxID=44386 RepID=A0A9J6FQA2_HAELO|nr:hypothetical protein HPB48_018564 [Haemaphysalis longicornis]